MNCIDRNIRSGDNNIDEYIEFLEDSLLSFDTSNIKRLLISADNIAGRLADDLDNIANGINMGFFLMSEDKEDKKLDRVLGIITKIESFTKISNAVKDIKPKIKDEVKEEESTKIGSVKRLNAFEKVIAGKKSS